jgi:hypothetical protein
LLTDTNTKDKTAATKEQYSQAIGGGGGGGDSSKETEPQHQEPSVVDNDNEVSACKESERGTEVTAIPEGNFCKSGEGGETT